MRGRPGFDATRRNRNIGTPKQGRGKDNRHGVPWPDDRHFAERLVDPVLVTRETPGEPTRFFVEPTLRDFVHACTIDDVVHLLRMVPGEDLVGLRVFVLRQPTRRQDALSPAWGRLRYASALGDDSGPAIFLEAQVPGRRLRWPKRLDRDDAKELERLRADGHAVESDRRRHVLHPTLASIRSTVLFRTIPHEIGHYVDYRRKVLAPAAAGASRPELEDRFWSRPRDERESFAHRYADELRERLLRERRIPFPRRLDDRALAKDGVERAWFEA